MVIWKSYYNMNYVQYDKFDKTGVWYYSYYCIDFEIIVKTTGSMEPETSLSYSEIMLTMKSIN